MFAKFQKITANPKAMKLVAMAMCLMVAMSLMTVIAAAEGEADMSAEQAATTIFEKITEQINVGAVVGVLAIGIGAGIALYFAWFAIRKVGGSVRKGLNGKSPF